MLPKFFYFIGFFIIIMFGIYVFLSVVASTIDNQDVKSKLNSITNNIFKVSYIVTTGFIITFVIWVAFFAFGTPSFL